ncbi:MAG: serine/threonine-protein kinase [Planctomycetota bacterium]
MDESAVERESGEETSANARPPMIYLEETDALLPRHWTAGSNKYRDFGDLASGGTAILKSAFDRNLHRWVVYKQLHDDLREDEDENRRFLREARVTSMIAHPGTVPVYEVGRDAGGSLYFTMKKLDGLDLRHVIDRLSAKDRDMAERYPLAGLVDVLISVCQTVAYAHAQGVVHRDLKPANVLIGAFGEVTVLDWGLAKVHGEKPTVDVELPDATKALELTQPGKRYGTPLYMSPEQARGHEVDERTDVYNAGSILYEMLALKNLVWGQSVEEVLEQVLERETPRPSDEAPWWREVPTELEMICLKALEKEPGERYASMEALSEDLIAFRAREVTTVEPETWWQRLRSWPRRHPRWMVAVAGGALALLVVDWVWGWLN